MAITNRLRAARAGWTAPTALEDALTRANNLADEAERQATRAASAETALDTAEAKASIMSSMGDFVDEMEPNRPTCDEYLASRAHKAQEATWLACRDSEAKRCGLPAVRDTEAVASLFGDPDDKIVGAGGGHSLQFSRVSFQGEFAVPVESFRAITKSRLLSAKSPLVTGSIAVRARYANGSGYTVKAEDPAVQALFDAFLADGYNEVVADLEELAKRYDTDGQLILPVLITQSTPEQEGGRVRVRRWDPRDMTSIAFEDDNAFAPEYLRLVGAEEPVPEKSDGKEEERDSEARSLKADESTDTSKWRVIRTRDDPDADWDEDFPQPFRSQRSDIRARGDQPLMDGDAIWARANMSQSDIGSPTVLPVSALADQHDLVVAQITRAIRLKTIYALFVKMEGFNVSQLEEFQQAYRLPKLGGSAVWFGNENSSIENVAYNIGTGEIEAHLLAQKIRIMIPFGITPSALGEELSATFAGAVAAQTPMRRALISWQQSLRRVLETTFRFVAHTGVFHGVTVTYELDGASVTKTIDSNTNLAFEVVMDELPEDAAEKAAKFATMSGAISSLATANVIGPEEAMAAAHFEMERADSLTEEEIVAARKSPLVPIPEQLAAGGGGGFGFTAEERGDPDAKTVDEIVKALTA